MLLFSIDDSLRGRFGRYRFPVSAIPWKTEIIMKLFAVTLCLILAAVPLHAEKYAGEFMALGGGARAMGMGGAFTAIASDVTTTFWNPAGIYDITSHNGLPNDWETLFMHSQRFGDFIKYDFLSAAFPLKPGESGWGITFIHMGIDDIRIIPNSAGMIGNSDGDDRFEPWLGESLEFDYRDFPLENVNDYAFFLSYAQLTGRGSFGASLKLIRNDQVTGVSSFGIGVDLGYLKRDLWKGIDVGLKLQDATGTYISWSTGKREFIYPALKAGIGYPIQIPGMNSVLVVAADGDFRYENMKTASQLWIGKASLDLHLGAELTIRKLVALRCGMDMGRPTAGVGFVVDQFGPWDVTLGFDYAFLQHDDFPTTHRVSLLIAH